MNQRELIRLAVRLVNFFRNDTSQFLKRFEHFHDVMLLQNRLYFLHLLVTIFQLKVPLLIPLASFTSALREPHDHLPLCLGEVAFGLLLVEVVIALARRMIEEALSLLVR